MKKFSERLGITKAKDTIQKNSMDDDLKTSIWNLLQEYILEQYNYMNYFYENEYFKDFFKKLWIQYFKLRIETLDSRPRIALSNLEKIYDKFNWFEVYDFLEFIIQIFPDRNWRKRINVNDFINELNIIFESELSAFRVIGKQITPITSEEEIQEIDGALSNSPQNTREHLNCALKFFSDKNNPNYRNSIKESISAVEAICKKITCNEKATLSEALKQIEINQDILLHPALKLAFEKLYAYTSDSSGIRHALLDDDDIFFEDAKYFLVTCSAFVNYLVVKADKAGIKVIST